MGEPDLALKCHDPMGSRTATYQANHRQGRALGWKASEELKSSLGAQSDWFVTLQMVLPYSGSQNPPLESKKLNHDDTFEL